jgi:hypothetical protein
VFITARETRLERALDRQRQAHEPAPDLAERLANDTDAIDLGGQRREIATLFTDIASFTALSAIGCPENFIRSGLVAFAAVIGRLSRGLRESITLQNLNVIGPLERGWVRQVLSTHATADFCDRGKLPRSKKPDKSIE